MHVLLSTYESHWDVEPMVGLAVGRSLVRKATGIEFLGGIRQPAT